MNFAYLCEGRFVHGTELQQASDVERVDAIALTKARTLLAYLFDRDRLVVLDIGDFTLYYPVGGENFVSKLATYPDSQHKIVAVVAAKFGSAVWQQPGFAFVENTFQVKTLFNEWLNSSRSFLLKNPDKLNELERHYDRITA